MARPPRERFEGEVALRARRFFPRLAGALSDQELARRVRSATAQGLGMGFSAKCDLARHVYLTLVLGPGFEDRFAWAQRILNAGGPPALRHRRLFCEVIDRLRNGLDPGAKEEDAEYEEPDDGG